MLIGVHGKARSGKNQTALYLQEWFLAKHNIVFQFGAFADTLKQMCQTYFELNAEQLWGSLKEKITPYGKNTVGRLGVSSNPDDYWTPREIMQALGSFFRTIDYDFWVKEFDKNLKINGVKNIIITDVRHINECEYVKRNGILVKVIRSNGKVIHGMDHESETALDGKPDDYFDVILTNDGTLDDLRSEMSSVVDLIISLQNLKNEGEVYDGTSR